MTTDEAHHPASALDGVHPPTTLIDWDIISRRAAFDALLESRNVAVPPQKDVIATDFHHKTEDDHQLLLRWYQKDSTPRNAEPGPAILYLHGGGTICGSVDAYRGIVSSYVSVTGIPFLCVDYRLAPENRYPIPLEDSYCGLLWLQARSAMLGINPTRIAVMGDSAGGGMAAALSLLARDRKLSPSIALQVLVYPMLDDRIVDDVRLEGRTSVSASDTRTSWNAYLGSVATGTNQVPQYAAAARMTDPVGLPKTYLEVGELDGFCRETVKFGMRLLEAGVEIELHLYSGLQHAFDVFAPDADASKIAMDSRATALRKL